MKKTYEQRWKEAKLDIEILQAWEKGRISTKYAVDEYNKLHPEDKKDIRTFCQMATGLGYKRDFKF